MRVYCRCGARDVGDCPGAWEKGCDLGANEAHAQIAEDPQPTPPQAPEEVDPQLPRKLLDVACRMRVGETLYRDDELVDAAAHALRTALAPQAKAVEVLVEATALIQECRAFFENCPTYDGADTDNLDTRCMDFVARAPALAAKGE